MLLKQLCTMWPPTTLPRLYVSRPLDPAELTVTESNLRAADDLQYIVLRLRTNGGLPAFTTISFRGQHAKLLPLANAYICANLGITLLSIGELLLGG